MNKIINRIRYVKPKDIFAPFIFIILLIPSIFIRIYNRVKNINIWLICEDGKTARDNGFYFYKYIREKHKDDYCYYVIDKKSSDYDKVKQYGNIIQFGGLKHWLYYLTAKYNISIHKHGNPCQSFFYIIHVVLGLYNNRVFLQHGITKDDSPWLYYKNTKFRFFVCGAKEEYEYIKKKFGYPENNLIYTGFPRFDSLHDCKVEYNKILIMPTWRNWMGGNYYSEDDFLKSEYYIKWNELLNNKELINYIEENGYIVLFYPHQHVQKYLSFFTSESNNIKIISNSTLDIQTALKTSQYLITDYSSVFMDFAYMEKLCIFYQFDYEMYRKYQLQEGYYKYEKGFGPVYYNEKELIEGMKINFNNKINDMYLNKMKSFFEKRDNKNCERLYNILKENETVK